MKELGGIEKSLNPPRFFHTEAIFFFFVKDLTADILYEIPLLSQSPLKETGRAALSSEVLTVSELL